MVLLVCSQPSQAPKPSQASVGFENQLPHRWNAPLILLARDARFPIPRRNNLREWTEFLSFANGYLGFPNPARSSHSESGAMRIFWIMQKQSLAPARLPHFGQVLPSSFS